MWIGDHRCGTLKSMGKEAEPDIVRCEPEESVGRFVKIEHYSQYLTLCEVQVMGKCADVLLITVSTSLSVRSRLWVSVLMYFAFSQMRCIAHMSNQ